jgi:ubiquinone/menaquinone biosynthesis C-methylase UbiE
MPKNGAPLRRSKVEEFYENSYRTQGFSAQRRYPNEEFCRFMGRNFFSMEIANRELIKVLEVGCGSGANLWAVAREGFDAYGLDISEASLVLAEKMLGTYSVRAQLLKGDMLNIPFNDAYFDVIVDVLSSCYFNEKNGQKFLEGVYKKLKVGGKFFSYFPSKSSDAFTNYLPATMLDSSTLSGIERPTAPFYGNFYPMRFLRPDEYQCLLKDAGFNVSYLETISRTYRNGSEVFVFIVVEAERSLD